MSSGKSERSKYQAQADAHMKHVRDFPEWMDQAVEALKPWGTADMTLQQAVAIALQAAYEAGTRGEYPERINRDPVRPARIVRSRPDPHTTAVRIQRTRLARTRV